jgi:hypothetical protein
LDFESRWEEHSAGSHAGIPREDFPFAGVPLIGGVLDSKGCNGRWFRLSQADIHDEEVARLPPFAVFVARWGLAALWLLSVMMYLMFGQGAVFEVPVYATTLALILGSREVQGHLVAMGWIRSALLGLFVLGLVVAQVSRQERKLYPLTVWNMYSVTPPTKVTIGELSVVMPTGDRKDVPLSAIMPRRNGLALYNRLMKLEKEPDVLERGLISIVASHPIYRDATTLEWRVLEVESVRRPLPPRSEWEETDVLLIQR